jgi:hypothetical protein
MRIEDRGWRIEDGGWRMEDRGWKTKGELKIANCKLKIES